MPFLFFSFWDFILPSRTPVTKASWCVSLEALLSWSKRAFTWYFFVLLINFLFRLKFYVSGYLDLFVLMVYIWCGFWLRIIALVVCFYCIFDSYILIVVRWWIKKREFGIFQWPLKPFTFNWIPRFWMHPFFLLWIKMKLSFSSPFCQFGYEIIWFSAFGVVV